MATLRPVYSEFSHHPTCTGSGKTAVKRRPEQGEQHSSCRNLSVRTKSSWRSRSTGKKFQVPERNSLLRCFQFISPETIPYGRFCWNQECQYCRVSCQLPDDDEPREMLSCKFIVMAGMEITELSQELKWCLRAKLPSDAPVSP